MTTTVVKRKDVFGFVRHVNLLLHASEVNSVT